MARANLELLTPFFSHPGWKNRPVLMVTNPVEVLCHRLWQVSGNPRVYGFGVSCDEQRYAEVLTLLAGAHVDPGEVGGFHAFGPLLRDARHNALLANASRLQGKRSAYSHSPCEVGDSQTWGQLLQAWTATEFRGTKPAGGAGGRRPDGAAARLLRGQTGASVRLMARTLCRGPSRGANFRCCRVGQRTSGLGNQ